MNKLTLVLFFLALALHGCCSLSEGARVLWGCLRKYLRIRAKMR